MKKIRKLLLLLILCFILVFSVTALAACEGYEDPEEFIKNQGNTIQVILDSTRDPILNKDVEVKNGYMDYRLKPGSPIPEPGRVENAKKPSAEGYVFVGYYEGTENADGSINFGNKWDFSRKVTENMTLYGKWLFQYKIRINYVVNGVVKSDSYEIGIENNAEQVTEIKDPSLKDHTFVQLYTDAQCTNVLEISNEKPFVHGCTQDNLVRDVYAQFIEGTWKLVRTPNDLLSISAGHYLYLMNDIDMSSLNGKNTVAADFSGAIEGNGHKISNLNYVREGTHSAKGPATNYCFGLFARLVGATVKNVTFENCTVQGIVKYQCNNYFYGFLAGMAEGDCVFDNVKFVNCELKPIQFDIFGSTKTPEQQAEEEQGKVVQSFFVGEGSNYNPVVETLILQNNAINLLANEYALQPNTKNKFC